MARCSPHSSSSTTLRSSARRATCFPIVPSDAEGLAQFLSDRRGSRVTVSLPQRGDRRRLVALATQNAVEALSRERAQWLADEGRRDEALTELTAALGLPKQPERIECYDMSNIQGTSAVGSMVVFVNGRPEPREYRRFRIRSGETPDDFRMMAEVLRRRFRRAAALHRETGALSLAAVGADEAPEGDGETGEPLDLAPGSGPVGSDGAPAPREVGWALPDLVIVDGGKGQLSTAVGVMEELELTDVPLAGLAKRFEELYVPGRSAPIVLARGGQGLYLVQRIRDEAHRFAITYHREVRGRRALRSELDDIAGVGPPARRPCSSASAASGAFARHRSTRSPPRRGFRASSRSGSSSTWRGRGCSPEPPCGSSAPRTYNRAAAAPERRRCCLGPASRGEPDVRRRPLKGLRADLMTWRRIAPWLILSILALAIVIDLPFNLLGDGVRHGSASTSRAGSGSRSRSSRRAAQTVTDQQVETARDIIERRVGGIGVSEPQVRTQTSSDGTRQIVVEVPGATTRTRCGASSDRPGSSSSSTRRARR